MWIGALGVNAVATGSEGDKTQNVTATNAMQRKITDKRLALTEKLIVILSMFFTSRSHFLQNRVSFLDVLNTFVA
jgi:hypothetical protein